MVTAKPMSDNIKLYPQSCTLLVQICVKTHAPAVRMHRRTIIRVCGTSARSYVERMHGVYTVNQLYKDFPGHIVHIEKSNQLHIQLVIYCKYRIYVARQLYSQLAMQLTTAGMLFRLKLAQPILGRKGDSKLEIQPSFLNVFFVTVLT